MKKDEDEKPQGAEGARFNGKQGFKKKHNNKQRGQEQTNTASESDSVWGHTVLRCTRKQYTR